MKLKFRKTLLDIRWDAKPKLTYGYVNQTDKFEKYPSKFAKHNLSVVYLFISLRLNRKLYSLHLKIK